MLMKILRTFLGCFLTGLIVQSAWVALVEAYGLIGGWFAAFIIISPMWFLNHYLGLIENEKDGAWIDMAIGIAVAGLVRDLFKVHSFSFAFKVLPVLLAVIAGGIVGGYLAVFVKQGMAKETEEEKV
ncbi:hypothetical protein EV203_101112 [Caldanaerobacter subterraneus]|uniref:Uncharacterized protein n=2 Tax=Caldanaerobacter subterraneus TaxID=911092 RepID=A0A4R2K951_9THEO|nr:hypothetical protein EV203_101112 [Caldanaerobacter subterraneus]